ncbi:T9SS type A sorting domain-containing protein [Flammeovirga pacifica]|uniref:Secretion system C-terminal sorting domain-containing protein n=1 Tax=Flammeovirga pacifica TaxID=915059 RepID=A0A1S1YS44_FLAPC|nr:T9SS type A sorting domain-containing protein [Flammeovirga pacifica]OHX63851.1 hypothetical protein NH26_19760 [Flammeovirga pacifica]
MRIPTFLFLIFMVAHTAFSQPLLGGYSPITPDDSDDQTVSSNEYLDLNSGTYDYDGNGEKSITVENNGVLLVRAGVTLNLSNLSIKDQAILYVERGAIVTVEKDFIVSSTGSSELNSLYFYANLKIQIDDNSYILGGNGRITYTGSNSDLKVDNGATVCVGSEAPEFYDPDHANYGGNGTEACDKNGNTAQFVADLPVELISFEAIASNASVVLQWATATEENASHFEIMRSTDQTNWEKVGSVDASGNTNFRQDYTFTDTPNSSSDVIYYRLDQYDFDGQSESFGPLKVNLNTSNNKLTAHVFPNPSVDKVNLQLEGLQMDQELSISIIDKMGKKVYQEQKIIEANSLLYNVQKLEGLQPGHYLIMLSSGSEKITVRFIKQ